MVILKRTIIGMALFITLIGTMPAAMAIRCQGKIIVPGDSIGKVRHYCPRPAHIQTYVREISNTEMLGGNENFTVVSSDGGSGSTTITTMNSSPGLTIANQDTLIVKGEKWEMNMGSRQLNTTLIFEDGVLIREEIGRGWGY